MIPTLRTMTKKSKMGFGKYKDKTVQEMIDLRRTLDLISAYYKLTSINYQEDILTELKITEQYRIEKPSANKEMYYKFLNENGYKLRSRGQGADKLKKQTKAFSKSQLQGMNHGR
jgi:t-SNARE complex subunit (syntaxin)